MEYRKNDVLTVKIEDMGHDGEGIGKVESYTLFVKDAVIGDVAEVKIMKAKKQYAYARLLRVLEPSPYRVEPACPVARVCGGCQLQALSYEKQLEFKEKKIRDSLTRIGGLAEVPMEPIIGMAHPFRYRNKAQFPVGTDKMGRLITGFYAGRTHQIMENRDCILGPEVNRTILDAVLGWMEKYGITAYDETSGKGLVRHVMTRCGFSTGELLVCLVVNGRRIPHREELVESLREIPGMTGICLSVNQERTNVIMGRELRCLWGRPYITDTIGDVKYRISPLSFYQVNPEQTVKLYELALAYADLHGNETVWDLYCGIGTISLFLAQKAGRVYGVEVVPEAIADARENARINGIHNVEFFVGKAEDVVPAWGAGNGSGAPADVVVVDPPRKGCEKAVLDAIARSGAKRVVYVSCDPGTLARDVKYLREMGYVVEKVRGVDMFPGTGHVETVVGLQRVDT